jgi:CDP-diacylglycerol pyrophosphatase
MRILTALLLVAAAAPADVRECSCDAAKPETLEARPCSLCREVEKAPPDRAVLFLKDINPTKPNRWLALPRVHVEGRQALSGMTPAQRTAFWTAAIEKARSLWGGQWGVAMNGDESRTQCHMHAHIGKLLDGVETTNFTVVDGPAAIPVPPDGTGLWIHPAGGQLHVHLGEQIAETVLVR